MQQTLTELKAGKKVLSAYQYPNSGKIRIKFASNSPVDLFIIPGNVVAKAITNPKDAISAGALAFLNRVAMPDQPIALPPIWQGFGWKLLVGNPTTKDTIISYEIFEG